MLFLVAGDLSAFICTNGHKSRILSCYLYLKCKFVVFLNSMNLKLKKLKKNLNQNTNWLHRRLIAASFSAFRHKVKNQPLIRHRDAARLHPQRIRHRQILRAQLVQGHL
jgi:hypothetical protein